MKDSSCCLAESGKLGAPLNRQDEQGSKTDVGVGVGVGSG